MAPFAKKKGSYDHCDTRAWNTALAANLLFRQLAAWHCKVTSPPASNASRHLFQPNPASQRQVEIWFLKTPIHWRLNRNGTFAVSFLGLDIGSF